MKFTPENIQNLTENQVIVVGTNRAGIHGAGAAKLANRKFGLTWGKTGLVNNTYGLNTKDKYLNTLSLEEIDMEIKKFLNVARKNPDKEFLVTLVGCGLAGLKPEQIMPFWACQDISDNVVLPYEFHDHS